MIASELIAHEIKSLSPTDTGEEALQLMEEGLVRHLPVVYDGKLLGIISEDDILDHDSFEPISSYNITYRLTAAHPEDHILEILEQVATTNLTCVPVVDKENIYQGVITLETLVHSFAASSSIAEPGAIIVLDIPRIDYSMSNISRIVESENGVILSSYISKHPDAARIFITLKVSLQEVQYLKASFERFGYEIKGVFTETEYVDALQERYESLMHFLGI